MPVAMPITGTDRHRSAARRQQQHAIARKGVPAEDGEHRYQHQARALGARNGQGSPDARATAMRPTALLQVQTRRNQNTGASRKEILSTGQFAPQKSANSTRSA